MLEGIQSVIDFIVGLKDIIQTGGDIASLLNQGETEALQKASEANMTMR